MAPNEESPSHTSIINLFGEHHIHITSTSIPPPTSSSNDSSTQPRSVPLSHLDRDSAIALGTLLFLILLSLAWTLHTRIQQRRQHLHDLEQQHRRASENLGSIVAHRIFRVDKQGTTGTQWPRSASGSVDGQWFEEPFEGGMEMGNRTSVCTLPRYEGGVDSVTSLGSIVGRHGGKSRGGSGGGGGGGSQGHARFYTQMQMEKMRDRRWWSSVARGKSPSQADRDEFPPLPPSPTLFSLSRDSVVERDASLARLSIPGHRQKYSFSRSPTTTSVYKVPPPPPCTRVHSPVHRGKTRGFQRVAWRREYGHQVGGIDEGDIPFAARRHSSSVDPSTVAPLTTECKDWATGKVQDTLDI
ncbi:hypothetical protein P280DRAFT_550084 [Massarina eburnea CBS 473.64]|uniref:Uncharacterized protein n=1 Tax=Massarina eburnea CBS 473.64 TaxID=1395130 RepID=A0A6A6RZA1_9PLEO|nr:hypothetical protein P280DRAFT_550084 [Massarina eburnea CBS 473.64]